MLTNIILIVIALMIAGREVAGWWRYRHTSPHTSYTSIDAAVDAVSRVVAGLHEDIDSLRRELRAAVRLPADTQVPRVVDDLRMTRLIAWTSLVLNCMMLVVLIILEAR